MSGDAISLIYTWKFDLYKKKIILFRFIRMNVFISNVTCVTIETIEQQNPPKNAVIYIVLTDSANTVKIHDKENGNDIKVNSLRRPYCRKKPPKTPPNNAPVCVCVCILDDKNKE